MAAISEQLHLDRGEDSSFTAVCTFRAAVNVNYFTILYFTDINRAVELLDKLMKSKLFLPFLHYYIWKKYSKLAVNKNP